MSETVKEFQKKVGALPDGDLGKETILKAIDYYKISKEQAAHFFGQTYHETGGFSLFTENLNYSAERLKQVFPKYFSTNVLANSYARKPQQIASRVYANRMGNGSESSGEGWKYRGRGALQLTGKDNYIAFSNFIKDPSIINEPDKVESLYAFDSAIHFFTKNKLWSSCVKVDDQSILSVTKRINGGVNGLAHRSKMTKEFYNLIT